MREPTGGDVIPEQPKHRDDSRALVIVPVLKAPRGAKQGALANPIHGDPVPTRTSESRLEEATGLALAIDLEITGGLIVPALWPLPPSMKLTGPPNSFTAL